MHQISGKGWAPLLQNWPTEHFMTDQGELEKNKVTSLMLPTIKTSLVMPHKVIKKIQIWY